MKHWHWPGYYEAPWQRPILPDSSRGWASVDYDSRLSHRVLPVLYLRQLEFRDEVLHLWAALHKDAALISQDPAKPPFSRPVQESKSASDAL